MADADRTPSVAPPVLQRAQKPAGILPKHTQALAIIGISFVMVLVIAFSGPNTPKDREAVPSPPITVTDANDERIRAYRARIDEEMQKLKNDQTRVAEVNQASGDPLAPLRSGDGYSAGMPAISLPSDSNASSFNEGDPQWIERDL